MSVKQAFLALLSQQPMHGYQLRQEFEARTGSTWPLNIGQAYTTLQRLERDGLVAPVEPSDEAGSRGFDSAQPENFDETQSKGNGGAQSDGFEMSGSPSSSTDGSPERFVLTESGQAAVDKWWTTPVERSAPARDELAIKLALAVTIPGVDIAKVVQTQRTATLRTLRDFRKLKEHADTSDPGGLAWSLVLESLIFSAEAEVRWLDHIEAAVAKAAAKRPAASANPIAPKVIAKQKVRVR